MSGGPAFSQEGKVIGVNVSHSGEQISFLVPVEYLKALLERALKNPDVLKAAGHDYLEKQLLDNQEKYMEDLLAGTWEKTSMGAASVPAEFSKAFKCW